MAQFKVGDVVQLKSGGPKMTVTDMRNPNNRPLIDCMWFEGVKQHEGTFPPDALKLFEKPGDPPQVRPFNAGGDY